MVNLLIKTIPNFVFNVYNYALVLTINRVNSMNINALTIGQVKELTGLLSPQQQNGLSHHIGEKVIVRTFSAGVWFGVLIEKAGDEVILKDARRMYRWKAAKSVSLSGVAVYGIDQSKSRICPRISKQWLKAIEIIPLTDESISSLEVAKDVVAS